MEVSLGVRSTTVEMDGMVDDRVAIQKDRAATGADLAIEEQVSANTRLEKIVSSLRERLDPYLRPGEPNGPDDGLAVARERASEHTERLRTQAERIDASATVLERMLQRLDI